MKEKQPNGGKSLSRKNLITKATGIFLKRPRTKSSPDGGTTEKDHTDLTENNYKLVDPYSRWIIIELSEDTSLEQHYEHIERTLIEVLGTDADSFIPVYKEKVQGKNVCYILFEGYVFVRRTDAVVKDIFKLRSEFIKGPLFVDDCMRLVSGVRINEYKNKLRENVKLMIPKEGQRVMPKIGVFKNLEGTVLSVDTDKLIAIVKFERTSRIVEAPINIVNLSILSGT